MPVLQAEAVEAYQQRKNGNKEIKQKESSAIDDDFNSMICVH
jgi:hypothetical protein